MKKSHILESTKFADSTVDNFGSNAFYIYLLSLLGGDVACVTHFE